MNERAKKLWGREGRGGVNPVDFDTAGSALPDEVLALDSPENHAGRVHYERDYKAFYKELIARDSIERGTGKRRAESLGVIHDLAIDFALLDLPDVVRYSPLPGLLPPKKDGRFSERWLYWRRLDRPAEIQDGGKGPISKLFYEGTWQGVIVRIKGDGLSRAILIPRGHLKSTLLTKNMVLWLMCRNPRERNLLRSINQDLSKSFVGEVKFNFEQNDELRKLYAHLVPAKRQETWASEELQLRCKNRAGSEPTLSSRGMESDLTGLHPDRILLDDIVAESNTTGPALIRQTRMRVIQMESLRNTGTTMLDIGTRWHEEDAHGLFMEPDSDDSFLVATALDDNPDGTCNLGISGRGNPIWPEGFSATELERRHKKIMKEAYGPAVWSGQYFNQLRGTKARTFSKDWVQYYGTDDDPISGETVAKQKRLDIFIAIDTATGKFQQNDKLDYSAAIVLGQTQDRKEYYILDGFSERLPAELIARGIVNLALKWKDIAVANRVDFKCVVEETSHTHFLFPLLRAEQRERGAQSYFNIEPEHHNNVTKDQRIKVLADPYARGRVYWPRKIICKPIREDDAPYNLIEVLEEQYVKCPASSFRDLIDAHAYAYSICLPPDYREEKEPQRAGVPDPSNYRRDESPPNDRIDLGGYQREDHWGLAL